MIPLAIFISYRAMVSISTSADEAILAAFCKAFLALNPLSCDLSSVTFIAYKGVFFFGFFNSIAKFTRFSIVSGFAIGIRMRSSPVSILSLR